MTYTNHFVGTGGNDSNDGLSWANRKLTLNGAEDSLSAARHRVYVGSMTLREVLTCDHSGPAAYTTGTVAVTNGSAVVTGSGTSWLANLEANDWFQCPVLAHGTDGVTNGTSTFTSASGNFQAGHVGQTIRISTKTSAVIASVVSATSITLADTAGNALTPSAGTGLTYDVGPSAPKKILSVDSDTQITLAEAWDDPTLTGIAYQGWGHIEYIGDYTGANTDGVGGVVRIAGSANDIAFTRANCITATSKDKRTFTGFQFDTSSNVAITTLTSCSNWVIQDCFFSSGASNGISFAGTGTSNSVLRCHFNTYANFISIVYTHSSTVDNAAGYVVLCSFVNGNSAISFTRVGGVTVKNVYCTGQNSRGVGVSIALTTGQANTINNSIIYGSYIGINATAVGEMIENYNNILGCNTARTNVTAGANSLAYPILLESRWFFNMLYNGSTLKLITPFDLSSASQLINVAGFLPTVKDMRNQTVQGAQREWGALEYDSTLKTQGGAGSILVNPGLSGGLR